MDDQELKKANDRLLARRKELQAENDGPALAPSNGVETVSRQVIRSVTEQAEKWEEVVFLCPRCRQPNGTRSVRRDRPKKDEYVGYHRCDPCEKAAAEEHRAKQIEEARSCSEVPKRFRGASLETYACPPGDAVALAAAKAWVDSEPYVSGGGLVLGGSIGGGKTHLAIGALREVAGRVFEAEQWWGESPWKIGLYAYVPAVVDDIYSAVRTRAVDDVLAKYLKAPLLLLDDLGAERGLEFERDRLNRVIGERWNQCRPTIVTTNTHPDDWDEVLGARTASRLRGIAGGGRWIVPVDADDYRLREGDAS